MKEEANVLKGISKFVGPDLLRILAQMGHGDEIVLADAHFPAHSLGPQVLRADGLTVTQLIDGILPLFELDSYATPLIMMSAMPGDTLDPEIEEDYMATLRRHVPSGAPLERIDRFAFYERARSAFAVVLTGELRKYGNLILKKGVTPAA
jgi:L-fucose mutarotase